MRSNRLAHAMGEISEFSRSISPTSLISHWDIFHPEIRGRGGEIRKTKMLKGKQTDEKSSPSMLASGSKNRTHGPFFAAVRALELESLNEIRVRAAARCLSPRKEPWRSRWFHGETAVAQNIFRTTLT